MKKVPCNTGIIVDTEGNILRGWSWAGDPTVANAIHVNQDDGECIEVTRGDYLKFHEHLGRHKFDLKSNCIVHKDSGEIVCKIKTPAMDRG